MFQFVIGLLTVSSSFLNWFFTYTVVSINLFHRGLWSCLVGLDWKVRGNVFHTHFSKVPENFQVSKENVRKAHSATGLPAQVPDSTWTLAWAARFKSMAPASRVRHASSQLSGLALRPEHLFLPGVLPECGPALRQAQACPPLGSHETNSLSPLARVGGSTAGAGRCERTHRADATCSLADGAHRVTKREGAARARGRSPGAHPPARAPAPRAPGPAPGKSQRARRSAYLKVGRLRLASRSIRRQESSKAGTARRRDCLSHRRVN